MEHSDITSYINLVLIFLTLSVSIYSIKSNQKSTIFYPMVDKLINEVFIPYQQTIGQNLFKNIDDDNFDIINDALNHLYQKINNTDLQFSLSYTTFYYLERMVNKDNEINRTQLKKYNWEYQNFSYSYFKDLNKFRKKSGLPKYTSFYRVDMRLYKNYTWVIKHYLKIFFIFIILVILANIS